MEGSSIHMSSSADELHELEDESDEMEIPNNRGHKGGYVDSNLSDDDDQESDEEIDFDQDNNDF